MDLPLQGTLASHDTDSPSLLRCLTFRTGYGLDHIQTVGSTSVDWNVAPMAPCAWMGSIATCVKILGDRLQMPQIWVLWIVLSCVVDTSIWTCLNRSTNHQIISNQIALLFAEEHREASLVWLLLAPHSFRLVKVATALSVTKTKRPNSTKKSLALCF